MRNTLKFLALPILTVVAVGLARSGIGEAPKSGGTKPAPAPGQVDASGPWTSFKKPDGATLRNRLDPLQYRVTQEDGTERAFQNTYWDHHEPGIYVDIVSGEPLFSSRDKFDSGTGWPSFTRPLAEELITEHRDGLPGLSGMEVRSRYGDSHLGHVFGDGPAPTGLRYCINSAALRFIPVDRMEAEGYGAYLTLFQTEETKMRTPSGKTEVATLAGGCFWGVEDILRDVPGVLNTEVGYTGGTLKNPTYHDLHDGKSGHAESVQLTFDPAVISYEQVLGYFFRLHDPTTKNRQGNDVGTQYRSAIFFHDPGQREIAEKVKRDVEASGKWPKPITTEITAASTFYPAEDYHQDYLEKNPDGYTCHYLRD